jgi:hypothetical protein
LDGLSSLNEIAAIQPMLLKKRCITQFVAEAQHPLLGALNEDIIRHRTNDHAIIPFLPVSRFSLIND